jgi:hypothetical protein
MTKAAKTKAEVVIVLASRMVLFLERVFVMGVSIRLPNKTSYWQRSLLVSGNNIGL